MQTEHTPPQSLPRRVFLRRAATGAMVIAAGPSLLAACTNADKTPTPSTSGGSGASTGTLKVGWSSEPDTMNPLTTYSTEANEVLQLVYDKLLDYDATLKVVPSLATSTEVSTDGKEVTYHVRQGVLWHDGTPFTADDVVFTY